MGTKVKIIYWRELDLEPSELKNSIAVMFDIFRCSSTIHSLSHFHADRIWVTNDLKDMQDSLSTKANFKIFSELFRSQQIQVDCAEKFDNSPMQVHLPENTTDQQHEFLVATTSGTPALFAMKDCAEVFVGSLLSLNTLMKRLKQETRNILLAPAAKRDSTDIEDIVVANLVRDLLEIDAEEKKEQRIQAAIREIRASPRMQSLPKKLQHNAQYLVDTNSPNQDKYLLMADGEEDIEICLDVNRYQILPKVNFQQNLTNPKLAKVER